MTDEEIIDKAVEKTLLMIPEIIGNLMTQHAALNKTNSKFYSDHPEFKDKKEIVASIIEMLDGKNPGKPYEEILKEAVPVIRERIKTVSSLDMTVRNEINRDFSKVNSDNGIL